jgi:uncharacterized protein Yka (UPF0111/DUF47 family)
MTRFFGRLVPRMPDFFGLLNDQCGLAVQTMDVFVAFMSNADPALAQQVRDLEHRGDAIKQRNMHMLSTAFSTPIDREDLYRAISTIDHVINYAKTTVREMEVLNVQPDQFTLEMAGYLRDGAESLRRGYALLATDPTAAEVEAQAARKAERHTEKAYRRALAQLFDVEQTIAHPERLGSPSGPQALAQVMDVLRRREIYRHLSNAADRVARAGEVLHDIAVARV